MSQEHYEVNASAVAQMVELYGWQELERYIALNVEELLELLASSGENDERNRGRIDAFRTILAWPQVVASEAEMQKLEHTTGLSNESDDSETFETDSYANDKPGVHSGSRRLLDSWLRSR